MCSCVSLIRFSKIKIIKYKKLHGMPPMEFLLCLIMLLSACF